MNDLGHEPAPEFRARLERDVMDAFRRQLQFAPTAQRARGRGLARTLVLAAGAVFALGIGLLWGVRSGFAAARAEVAQQPDSSAALAALRKMPMRKAIAAITCQAVPAAAGAPQGVPIVDLPPASEKTAGTFGGILGVRQVASGNILLNDGARKQLSVFSNSLALVSVALDSTPGTSNSYGPRPIAITPYLGDSTLTQDVNTGTLLVLGPNGRAARTMASPTEDLPLQMRIAFSGVDAQGRILYTTRPSRVQAGPAGSGPRLPPQLALGLPGVYLGDSNLVLRADLDSRRVDTIARLKTHASTMMVRSGGGPLRFAVEPAPTIDEWALLSDGSIAIVRGQDYHIDWIHADGSTHATTKLPFDWKRLTDEDKQRLIDSVRLNVGAELGVARAQRPAPGGGNPDGSGRGAARGQGPPDNGPPRPPVPTEYVPPALKDVPDYYPPIREHALMPDLDGNLWILPTSSAQSKHGELVYDVVNVKGEFRRVRLPVGRSIAGFGKGGVVYLQAGDKAAGFVLERTRLPK